MKKFLTTSVSLFALSLSPVMAQSFSDAGTDYTNTTAEFWTEDQANELVSMPDAFACIIKNSRGDLLPNSSWEALIDEEECFGGAGDDDGGSTGSGGGSTNQQASNATEFARVKMVSERTSNDANQQITAFFESIDGGHYVANVDMESGPTESNPLGEWYFAYFAAGDEQNSISVDEADNYGFVNIEENTDGDIVVSAADVYNDGSDSETSASIVKYDDTTVAFAGFMDENNTGNLLAGKTNATHYYRVQFNNVDTVGLKAGSLTAVAALLSDSQSTTDACYALDNQWDTVNRYALFSEDGSAVEMTGGFGFETTGDSSVRGYLGNWGVWLDTESPIFTPTNSTASIQSFTADNEDPVSRTLNWAGGELFRIENLTEALADGTKFQTWRYDSVNTQFNEVYATYDATDNEFVYTLVSNPSSVVGTLSTSAAIAAPWEAEFWSIEKQTMVRWDADAADADGTDQIIFTQTTSVSAADAFLDNDSLPTFKNVEDAAPDADMPIKYADYDIDAGTGFGGTSDSQTYILSGANPATGLEARTLYLESGDAAGLDADDSPVRFDFAMTMDAQNCSNDACMGRYTTFTSGATAADYTSYNWPQKSVRLYDTSDSGCTSDINASGCTHYEWRFGANTWDNSILAFNSDDSLVTISPPLRFSYIHDEANERNGTQTLILQDDGGYGLTANSDGDYEVTRATFDDNKFLLEYDGTSLHGLPMTFDETTGDWGTMISLVNLVDSTQLTDLAGTTYRVKATEVSQTFQETAISDCVTAGVSFDNPTTLGITFDEIPDIADEVAYPRPDEAWSDAPADDALTCTVTHGDPGNCSVAAE